MKKCYISDMYTIGHINIMIEILGIFTSFAVMLFLLTGSDRNSKLNLLFMRIVICNIAAMFFDAFAWGFDGNTTAHGIIIARASKFITYVLQFLLIPLLTDYVAAIISQKVKIGKTIQRIMYAMFIFSFFTVVLSQWNNMYYIYDENNHYQVQSMFWLSQLIGAVFLILVTFFILKHKKSAGKYNTLFLLSYPSLPILAIGIHLFRLPEMEFIFISSTLAIVISYGGIQARQAKLLKDKELELTNARIDVMLSQIQPHFLYNALVVIRHLCKIDPKMAEETVVEFSEYLRGNLDSLSLNEPIPFERELRHVEKYLSIEKKRFGDKLTIKYDIKAKDFMIPILTLQPIAENAVRYGITKKEQGGAIEIKTEETQSGFIITVTDDGAGFDATKKPENDNRSHIGIENTRNRLAVMCGGTLEIKSALGKGTTAVITLPK